MRISRIYHISRIGPIRLIAVAAVTATALAVFALGAKTAEASALQKLPNNLGLVGYWSMEDGVGTQATDFSGRGNTGTLTNGPTWVAGKRGRALNFDGNNDYVNIDSSLSSVPAYTESTPYTIAFWVKGAPNQVYNGVYSEGSSSTDTPYVVIRTQNGTNKMQIIIVNDAGGIRLNAATTNSVVFDNAWHHFAWVSNGATSKVYVDGVQDTGDFSSFSSSGGTYTLNERTIGTTRGLTSGTSFSGSIDDVRIYNRALSATEVTALYQNSARIVKANRRQATIALDATSSYGTPVSSTSSLTWAHTVGTGSNRALVVAVGAYNNSGNGGQTVSGITYAGVALTKIRHDAESTIQRTELWYLVAPTTGANNIVVTMANTNTKLLGFAASLTGVNQATPVSASGGSSGGSSSISSSATVGTTGTFGIDIIKVDYDTGNYTANSPQTERYEVRDGTNPSPGAFSTMSTVGTGSVSMGWGNLGGNQAHSLVYIAPAPMPVKMNVSKAGSIGTSNLVLWQTFDGNKLNGTTATDSSPSGNNGTFAGSPVPKIGKIGQAFNFDGVGDYVNLGNPSQLNISDAITVSAWIKVSAFDKDWEAIIAKGDSSYRLARRGDQNVISFGTTGVTVSGSVDLSGTFNVNDGRWHHIVGVWGGSANQNKYVYVDGAVDASGATSGTLGTNSDSVFIGDNGLLARGWNGSIDDVRVYNRALSAAEVLQLYNAGK